MNINRNNYESFFLLYVDGELTVAEKKAVEAFVRQNPDLQEELNMLQETVLPPQPFTFAHKADLYKKTITAVSQKQLLLYLDNELPADEARAIAQQLATDEALQKEWAILQQAKLQPEAIPFTNKEALYRHERGRVIVGKWWRIAAAALLLGFGVWGGMRWMNQEGGHTGNGVNDVAVVKNNSTVHQQELNTTTNTVDNNGNAISNPVEADPGNIITTPEEGELEGNHLAVADPVKAAPKKQAIPQRLGNDPTIVAGQNDLDRLKKNVQKTLLENFNTDNGNETSIANVTPTNKELEPIVSLPVDKINTEKETGPDKVLKGNPAANTNDMKAVGATDSYLATGSKKSRRSGLLRKVTRFFQRSVQNRGEGDGLKIAGFEFAVK